jgi:uncharacterized protein YdeI (YjbR/CyaY-like superfamily)
LEKKLELLRLIVLETGLKEEIKWSVPIYTKNGKNTVTVNSSLKEMEFLRTFHISIYCI